MIFCIVGLVSVVFLLDAVDLVGLALRLSSTHRLYFILLFAFDVGRFTPYVEFNEVTLQKYLAVLV